MKEKDIEEKHMTLEEALSNKNFEKEYGVIIINNNKPVTFTKEDYRVKEGEPHYTDAIKNKRSGKASDIISNNTLAIFTSENIDYPPPVGWTDEIQNARFYNRSHIIAYSLSAKKCDKDNIFIGTKHLNKITMREVEIDIYKEIKEKRRTYLYKVTPQYKTADSSIPFAVLIEAETIDYGEKKTVCGLCYNVQKGQKIDYYKRNNTEYKEKDNQDKENVKYKHYSINVKTKTFHLFDKECRCIQKIKPKYIQETKANVEDIINRKFKLCKICTNYHQKKG